jgi:transglutaminase-like putative cysteine protease
MDVSENMTLLPDFTVLSAEVVRDWQVEVVDLRLNGRLLQDTSITDYVSDVDWAADGSQIIPLTFNAEIRITDANGQPVTNQQMAAQLSLPAYNYAETVQLTTDSNGTATYQRTEQIIISVIGGQIQQLAAPVEIEGASAETVNILDAWQDNSTPVTPTPIVQTPTPQPGVCVSVSTSKPAYLVGEDVQIKGKVTDCRGATLPNVSVSVSARDSQGNSAVSWSGTSDAAGNFTVGHRAQEPYGTYTATATASNSTGSDSASVSYEISSSVSVGLTAQTSLGSDYSVTVPLTKPVTYNVYQRGNDTIKTNVTVTANPAFSMPTDVQVVVELYKADKDGVMADFPTLSEQRTVTISTDSVTVSPAVEFPLPGLLPVGYYKVRAAAFAASGGSTVMGEGTVDVAIIFNPPPEMANDFVTANTARFWWDGGSQSYDLQPRDGKVFKFALDAVDDVSDETSAASKLYSLTQFMVKWVQGPIDNYSVVSGLSGCNVNNTSDAANKDCVFAEDAYLWVLTAFSRAVGIPARPVTGGAGGGAGVGAKDVDEFAEASGAALNYDAKLPGDSGYKEDEYNVTDWNFHVWSELYINGAWHVYDANQNYTDTQNGYGQVWIDDWRTKLNNALGYPGDYPSSGLKADKKGGGEESLDDAYLSTPTPTPTPSPTPTDTATPTLTPSPNVNSVASSSDAPADGDEGPVPDMSPSIGSIVIRFESPVTHLSQDIVFSVELTNSNGEAWTGSLDLNLYGSPITNPAAGCEFKLCGAARR